jgi:hypothetical protein
MAKPVVIERPQRKCGGCVETVAWLIPGDLHGCPELGTAVVVRPPFAVEKSAEAVVPAGIVLDAGKGRTQSRGDERLGSCEPR